MQQNQENERLKHQVQNLQQKVDSNAICPLKETTLDQVRLSPMVNLD